MVAVASVVTAVVVTENVWVVAPSDTVTVAGTVTPAVSLVSVTSVPPEGAAPVKVTVPVEGVPPRTLVGLRLTDASVGAATAGLTVKSAALISFRAAV
jgi:hypothetical protein